MKGSSALVPGRVDGARARRAAGLLAALALATGGCVTLAPEPTLPSPAPTPVADAAPTPTPRPTARSYVVRPNDTLSQIARRFGLTVGQLLTANPQVTDPDLLRVGQVLTIPPPGAPDTSPSSGGIADGRDDLVGPDEEPATGEGYADIGSLGIRAERRSVRIDLGLTRRPPPRVDPEFEMLAYTVVIDVDDDGQPDYRLKWANDADDGAGMTATLEDRTTARILSGRSFPGEVSLRPGGITWTVDRDALGGGERWRIAAKAERSFYPGGRGDPEVDTTLDYAPNQQWPRPNPRWVELGAPLASPAP